MGVHTTDALTIDGLATETPTTSLWVKRIMWIAWPSFLMAGVLEILVFAMVDPEDMHWFGSTVQFSREGIYTVSFFAFWLVTMLSSALTIFLATPYSEVKESLIKST